MKKGLVVLALLALLPWSAVSTAETSSTSLNVLAFRVGDAATYTTPTLSLNITVQPFVETLNRAGELAEAVTFRYEAQGNSSFLNISTRSMLAENWASHCARKSINDPSACLPWRELKWAYQGLPAAFGASLLQGRTFSVGDEWTVGGDCAACAVPIQVRIEAPALNSPAGTSFVANVSYSGKSHPMPDWLRPATQIHMGTAHAFPLLAESVTGASYTLAAYTPGTQTVAVGSLESPAFTSALASAVVPFEGGRPVEGTPLPGHPSWADARRFTKPDAADTVPGASFYFAHYGIETSLLFGESWLTVAGNTVNFPPIADEPVWETQYARPGQPDLWTEYRAFRPLPNVTHNLPIQAAWPWKHETEERSPTPLSQCSRASAPMWDTARFVLGLPKPILEGFEGLGIFSGCSRTHIWIAGPAHAYEDIGAFRIAYASYVELDATTGLLRDALIWPPGTPG